MHGNWITVMYHYDGILMAIGKRRGTICISIVEIVEVSLVNKKVKRDAFNFSVTY